jgi:hypothetical protein
MRPTGLTAWIGRRSENAAHRVAVEWDGPDGARSGVYIPRRDSDSLVNVLAGGRLYPGRHHRARFQVSESATDVHVAYAARDRSAEVDVSVRITDDLTGSALFAGLADASLFFEQGSVGYSTTDDHDRLDGLQLHTNAWKVQPAEVLSARSTFFDDESVFPPGSADLDCALVMRRVPVEWSALSPPWSADAGMPAEPR